MKLARVVYRAGVRVSIVEVVLGVLAAVLVWGGAILGLVATLAVIVRSWR